jgi:hypothetical protein
MTQDIICLGICLAYAWYLTLVGGSCARYMQSICHVYARNIYMANELIMPYCHMSGICQVYTMVIPGNVFLCILRYHCSSGLVWQYEQMLEDLVDDQDVEARPLIGLGSSQDRKSVPLRQEFQNVVLTGSMLPYSELRSLKAMLNREDLHLCVGVSLLFIFLAYAMSYYKRNLGI